MKLVPIAFSFIFISSMLLKDTFYLNNAIYHLTKIPMIELYVASALLIVAIGFALYPCSRNQSKDLLS